jgi:hypothetical protein
MQKPFDSLYAGMENALRQLGQDLDPLDRNTRALVLVGERIREMTAAAPGVVTSAALEVSYFRDVWPAFYGALFLYAHLHQFEQVSFSSVAEFRTRRVQHELARVSAFFHRNREFWMYYRSGSQVLDEQFTRAYSRQRVLEPLSLVIDPQGATLASYRAARCRAMEGYGGWLAEERDRLSGPGSVGDYTWAAADADFVEWLFGLQAVGAIRYKGQPVDINQLTKWGKWALNEEVANIHDRFKVLRNRKKERMVFTRRTAGALEMRMDRAEGKIG